jgi:predicted RNase H-like nuclease
MEYDPPVFIGLDLAWSSRNRTGAAVIRAGRLVASCGGLQSDESILAFVAEHLPAQAAAVVAVDAPLCVPNAEGRRRCDGEVSKAWGKYEAGAYPANRRLLAKDGSVRGEVLAAALAERHGFVQTAPLPLQGGGRYLCEVFPHPAHVALFSLPRTLKYKRKKSHDRSLQDSEMARYQQLLAGLAQADPPLLGLDALTSCNAAALRGKGRKELEDALDAVTCAYVGYYAWWHGPERQQVYGSIAEGHILTPPLPSGAVRHP